MSTRIPKGSNKRGAKVMGEKEREWEVKWKGWDAKDNTFESLNAFLSNDGISASLVEFELDRSGLIPCTYAVAPFFFPFQKRSIDNVIF